MKLVIYKAGMIRLAKAGHAQSVPPAGSCNKHDLIAATIVLIDCCRHGVRGLWGRGSKYRLDKGFVLEKGKPKFTKGIKINI